MSPGQLPLPTRTSRHGRQCARVSGSDKGGGWEGPGPVPLPACVLGGSASRKGICEG